MTLGCLLVGLREPNNWLETNVGYLSLITNYTMTDVEAVVDNLILKRGFAVVLVADSAGVRKYVRSVSGPYPNA